MPAQKISLFLTEGSMDKVYEIHMQEQDDGFVVFGMNGRRGSSLKMQPKTNNLAVSEAEASAIFASLLKGQKKKGYTPNENGVKFQGTEHAGKVTGLEPQLLNEVPMSEVEKFINDPLWMAQQKCDGECRPLGFGSDGAFGANRQGLQSPLPVPVADALASLGVDVHLVSEAIDSRVMVFDLTHHDGQDWKNQGAENRYLKLQEVLSTLDPLHQKSVVLLPTAFTPQEKRAMLEGCLHHGQEGIVFKRKDSPFVPGRPSKGGDQLKVKFWEFANVIFGELNKGKRSVQIHQLDENAQKIALGNVTIPSNADVPDEGSTGIVKYLYAFKKGSLFEPSLVRATPEISPDKCLTSSLKFKCDHIHVDHDDFMKSSVSMRP